MVDEPNKDKANEAGPNAGGGNNGGSGNNEPSKYRSGEWSVNFSNPIVVLASLILLSLFVMIGAAMMGIDHGFLNNMARADLARGLITYLFAVVTIGIAVALVLSTLVGPESNDATDGRFQRGKEVLSLLLGVFGTIVGFYFGSEATKASGQEPYALSTLDLAPEPVGPTGLVTIRAVVKGGTPPYHFGVAQGTDNVDVKDLAYDGGWIVKQFQLPAPKQGEVQTLHLIVEDSGKKRVEQSTPVRRSLQD